MSHIAEDFIRAIKEKIYQFVDNLKDIDDFHRAKLAQNIALNLLCQLTIEIAFPEHVLINECFDELLLDIDIWRKSYIFDHPESKLDNLCDGLRPTSIN